MRLAALVSWLVTAGLGAFMLRTWLARGGLRRERARVGGLPPQMIFGHAALAITGLLIWAAYLASGTRALAWTAVAMLTVTVSLGLCTVTLWTPYPARRPGERRPPALWDARAVVIPDTAEHAAEGTDPLARQVTDEMIAQLLEGRVPAAPHRRIRPNPAVLVPIAHGFAAMTTFLLIVLAASM